MYVKPTQNPNYINSYTGEEEYLFLIVDSYGGPSTALPTTYKPEYQFCVGFLGTGDTTLNKAMVACLTYKDAIADEYTGLCTGTMYTTQIWIS